LNAAGAIRLTADAGTSETIILHADQGSGAASICLTSDAGGITLTPSSAVTVSGALTVGVDDTGHDVTFFGASAGAYMIYDQSEDQLEIRGASADAATSTGKLLLTTALTNINACDVIGSINFQAPLEAGSCDAILVAAGIRAVAQATFTCAVNATDLIFYTGHSEAAAERFRFTSQNEIGVAGANYGTDGQVLTSGGAGAAVAWEDAGGISGLGSTDNVILRANGTGGATAQGSSASIADCGKVTFVHQILGDQDCTNAAGPGYAFRCDTDTGMFQVSANKLGWSTAGTSRMSLNACGLDLANNSLLNVGAATNDWTAATLSMATANKGGTTPQVILTGTNAGDEGPEIRFIHDSGGAGDNDIPGLFRVLAEDSGGTNQCVHLFYVRFEDVTQSSMDSSLVFRVSCNVNNGESNTNATLTKAGVWTDASGEITKAYEGSALDVWGGRPCHVVLDKIMSLNVGRYHSSRQPACKPVTERHISPTAEQMWDVFGVGKDPREIVLNERGENINPPGLSPKDLGGVALMGIQELTTNTGAVLNSHERRLEELEERLKGGCSG